MADRTSLPARLEDVAARVGISPSEVSRVLNGRARSGKSVATATRDRILQAAREMNYSPNSSARNLVRGRTDIAALVMFGQQSSDSPFVEDHDAPDELAPHYHEIIGGLTYTMNQHGLQLMLTQCGGPGGDPIAKMEEIARSRACDGMIITDMLTDDPRPALLDGMGLPYVVRGTSPIAGAVAVGMDNAAVGYGVVRYLYGLGHRRILFCNIRTDLMVGQGRQEGMERARAEMGLEKTLEYHNDVHHQGGMLAFLAQRLQEPHPPTAIFAEDEISALGAEQAIKRMGLRIPEDISLITCLNARFMRRVVPHLTVFNVRLNESAIQSGHLLVQMLQGKPVEKRQILLPPLLEENGSAAPPP